MSMLEVEDLRFRYGIAAVIDGVDLVVDEGEVVTIVGPNGAGKSTLLNVVAGAHRRRRGSVRLDGHDTARMSQAALVRKGCVLVPEGRQVFATLSVVDNLLLGGYVRRRAGGRSDDVARVFDLFPRLEERRKQQAGSLSGGEQQMLAIGRAMMGRPRLLLLDEPSLGLAPQLVARIFAALARLRDDGVTLLLVEQNAHAALALADRAYLLQAGRVQASGTAAELSEDPLVRRVYLGEPSTGPVTEPGNEAGAGDGDSVSVAEEGR